MLTSSFTYKLCFIWLCLPILLSNCRNGSFGSARPGNQNGMCNLNCSDAILGSNDPSFSIKPLLSPITYTCSPSQQNFPLQLQWQAVEKYKVGDTDEYSRPVPFLSIAVSGPGTTNSGSDVISSGITTPEDLRCTDACGVITINLTASCPVIEGSSHNFTLLANSGPLISEPIQVTVNKESPLD